MACLDRWLCYCACIAAVVLSNSSDAQAQTYRDVYIRPYICPYGEPPLRNTCIDPGVITPIPETPDGIIHPLDIGYRQFSEVSASRNVIWEGVPAQGDTTRIYGNSLSVSASTGNITVTTTLYPHSGEAIANGRINLTAATHISGWIGVPSFGPSSTWTVCANAPIVSIQNRSPDRITILASGACAQATRVDFVDAADSHGRIPGFDKTNAVIGDYTFPPNPYGSLYAATQVENRVWASVGANGGTVHVTAQVYPPERAANLTFESSNNAVASVVAQSSSQPTSERNLLITGFLPGEAAIIAKENGRELNRLKVASYSKRKVKVNAFVVTIKRGGGCPYPTDFYGSRVSEETNLTFAAAMNRIFAQANVEFAFRFDDGTVGADIDGDCRLKVFQDETFSGALDKEFAILYNSVRGAPQADVNVFYLNSLNVRGADDTEVVGVSLRHASANNSVVIASDGIVDIISLTAHELGHHLGLPHCDSALASISNNCGARGDFALMYSQVGKIGRGRFWLSKPEWDCINPGSSALGLCVRR